MSKRNHVRASSGKGGSNPLTPKPEVPTETPFLRDSKSGATEEGSTEAQPSAPPCPAGPSKCWELSGGRLRSETPRQKGRQGAPQRGLIWAVCPPTRQSQDSQDGRGTNRLTGGVLDDHLSSWHIPDAQLRRGSLHRVGPRISLIFCSAGSVRGCGFHREPSSVRPSNFQKGAPHRACCTWPSCRKLAWTPPGFLAFQAR